MLGGLKEVKPGTLGALSERFWGALKEVKPGGLGTVSQLRCPLAAYKSTATGTVVG